MGRRVKEFIDIPEHSSLEGLIAQLSQLRDTLPADCDAELRLRGDEVFGRKLSISYFRDQTAEERECEARYADSCREGRERDVARARGPAGTGRGGRRKLRIVA